MKQLVYETFRNLYYRTMKSILLKVVVVMYIVKRHNITEAKVHDKNFLKSLDLATNTMIVFDKAYNYYHQFALWTNKVYFVTRQKSNAKYELIDTKCKQERVKNVLWY